MKKFKSVITISNDLKSFKVLSYDSKEDIIRKVEKQIKNGRDIISFGSFGIKRYLINNYFIENYNMEDNK